MSDPILLSKSKYVAGLQCDKRLWTEYNDRALIPETDEGLQAIYDQGKEVGQLARQLFPDGIEVTGDYREYGRLSMITQSLLPQGKPLFEPAFRCDGGFCRVDILVPVTPGVWDMIEVKSSGEVKDVYLDDISFQYHVCRSSGLTIRRAQVMHINKTYVRNGSLDLTQLFVCSDVTDVVREKAQGIGAAIAGMRQVIAAGISPERAIGPHCSSPYECPLMDHCWSFLPTENIFTLYRMQDRKGFELLEGGCLSIRDLPLDYETTDRREIQIRAVRTGEIQIDRERIRSYLDGLVYPLYFLDFETIYPAIPRYGGTRPFQQIPFQFSLHIVSTPDAAPEHHSFLAEGQGDPRPGLLRRLELLLSREGSIVVYNATFERGCLMDCGESFPDYSQWCDGIVGRLSDLCLLFSDFSWYHPDQHGSASMKSVLPLLTGLSYDNLPIADGTSASTAFMRMTFGEMGEEEKRKTREDLERYCGLDTLGMVAMVEAVGDLKGSQ